MNIRKIYEYALGREIEGKRFFEENAARLSHAAAIEAFSRLAEEEQKHIEFIQIQLAALEKGQEADLETPPLIESGSFFSRRAVTQKLDQTVLEAMVPDLPVLRMAFLLERDFAEFYEHAANGASGQAKKVLQMLATWERGHERLFKEFHDMAFTQYAGMPWGG